MFKFLENQFGLKILLIQDKDEMKTEDCPEPAQYKTDTVDVDIDALLQHLLLYTVKISNTLALCKQ